MNQPNKQPINTNGIEPRAEPIQEQLYRMEARVGLEAENADMARMLAATRADRIESMSVTIHAMSERLSQADAVTMRVREAFRVNLSELPEIITVIENRERRAKEMIERAVAFTHTEALNPSVNPDAMQSDHHVITGERLRELRDSLTVLTYAIITIDGLLSGAVEEMPEPLPEKADGIMALAKSLREPQPKPTVPQPESDDNNAVRYYCPVCNRHVAPEDTCGGRGGHAKGKTCGPVYHSMDRGGCGGMISVRLPLPKGYALLEPLSVIKEGDESETPEGGWVNSISAGGVVPVKPIRRYRRKLNVTPDEAAQPKND